MTTLRNVGTIVHPTYHPHPPSHAMSVQSVHTSGSGSMANDPRFRLPHIDALTDAIKASIKIDNSQGLMSSENGWYRLSHAELRAIVNTSEATNIIKARVDKQLVDINEECPNTTIYGVSATSKHVYQLCDIITLDVEYNVENMYGNEWTIRKDIPLGEITRYSKVVKLEGRGSMPDDVQGEDVRRQNTVDAEK
nr:hypothetical protein L203_00609 [Cryptococcus depauperatus CBS 7841]